MLAFVAAYPRHSAADNALVLAGLAREVRGDCAGALEDFRVAQATRPNDALAWASTGLAQMCLGDQAAAQQSLARAHALDPRMPLP